MSRVLLLSSWPAPGAAQPAVLCPCLRGLPPDLAPTLGILPIHDANAELLAGLADRGPGPPPAYAGVCLTDPFRRVGDVFAQVRAAGIGGIANLPSVAGLFGEAPDDQLLQLYRREMTGLLSADAAGFQILCVIPDRFEGAPARLAIPKACVTVSLRDFSRGDIERR